MDADEGDDELLDSRPAPQSRRWWVLGVVGLVAVIVAAVLVQRSTSPTPSARTTPSPTPTTTAPVLPAFSTGAAVGRPAERKRAPGACPSTEPCTVRTASEAVLATIRAAIRSHLGDASDLRITALTTTSASHPSGSVLFSRTITATVPAGRLKILVSSSSDDATVDLDAAGGLAELFGDSFVDGYYTHAVLSERHGAGHAIALLAALDRLVNDSRLVAGRG